MVQSTNEGEAESKVCDLYEDSWELGTKPGTATVAGCLPASTMVVMADGQRKEIGKISLGESVLALSYANGSDLLERKVEGIRYGYNQPLSVATLQNGDLLVSSFDQRVVTVCGPVRARHLFPGATVLNLSADTRRATPSESKIDRVDTAETNGDVVSLDIGGDFGFFAQSFRSALWVVGCHSGGDDGNAEKK